MNSTTDIKDLIIEGIRDRKGLGITIVDMSGIDTAATSAFIIAEGTSTMHTSSIADSVEEYVRTHGGGKPLFVDGEDGSDWVVMDYGSVFVHIFLPPTRLHYNLEELWADAEITKLEDQL